MPEAGVIAAHNQDDARWFREADHAVEVEAERLREGRAWRALRLALFSVAMGFVLGSLFENWSHVAERFLEWVG